MANFMVLRWQGSRCCHTTVSNERSFEENLRFFVFWLSCSKAEWREVGTTATSQCTPLTHTDLVAERKQRTLQVARENWVAKFAKVLDAPASLKSDVQKHFSFSTSRSERGEKETDGQKTMYRHRWAITKTRLQHFLVHILTFEVKSLFLANTDCTFSESFSFFLSFCKILQ